MDCARSIWEYFDQNCTRKDHWLPPDNVQIQPPKGAARRTSPTNMGLYLLSCCAAREMKLISLAECARRIEDALGTMEGLSAWKGHFYNWYDLDTLEPMQPLFVSTVDSGNLMGTARTLDGCSGPDHINSNDPMETGILSRTGNPVDIPNDVHRAAQQVDTRSQQPAIRLLNANPQCLVSTSQVVLGFAGLRHVQIQLLAVI